jgi:WD40 repeat protein
VSECWRVMETYSHFPLSIFSFLQGISSVCAMADGLRVVSGSSDKTLRVWNVVTGCCEQVLRGHGEVSGADTRLRFHFLLFLRRSSVFVPCRMVFGWSLDRLMGLCGCGMWSQDLVSKCWMAMNRFVSFLRFISSQNLISPVGFLCLCHD